MLETDPRMYATWSEALKLALGLIIVIVGFVGPLMAAPSCPGPVMNKLIVALIGLVTCGIGVLSMIWGDKSWSARLKKLGLIT